MGLRYRKSINLGGGFRVNFSKSGVGYSWGTKGYRVTKKAGGGVRRLILFQEPVCHGLMTVAVRKEIHPIEVLLRHKL